MHSKRAKPEMKWLVMWYACNVKVIFQTMFVLDWLDVT